MLGINSIGSDQYPHDSRRPSQNSAVHSVASSSHGPFGHNVHQRSSPESSQEAERLLSQYPPDPENNHVEFILVAHFDIGQGSIMEYQYPTRITDDEELLAQLMLPEGAHSRQQDWTVFLLHKEGRGEGDRNTSPRASFPTDTQSTHDFDETVQEGAERDADGEDEDEAPQGPPLTYVLNLVNRRYDSSVKRGAVFKAMAICTRHPFVDIFKPVLVLAIDEYWRNPTPDTLELLYNSLNSMDLSLIPRLSPLERTILQASTAKDLFIEKFDRMIEQQQMDEDEEHANGETNGQRSDTAKQAAALQSQRPRDTHEYVSRINFNGHSVPVKVPTAVSSETVGNFSTIKLIQTFSGPHATSPQPFTLHEHLTTNGAYTHPMIVLINAILTQKRVMFLGHNTPSEEVAEAVLAACALASGGVLRGFIRHAFPYTDLTKVDTLKEIPGYVAGVTNPVFATTPDLWDVFCDIQSGRMKISSDIAKSERSELWTSLLQQNPSVASAAESQAMQPPDFSGDLAFIERVQRSITDRLGEGVIRSMWRDWIVKFTRMAAAYEEMSFGASSLYIGAQDTDRGDFGLRGHGYVWKDEGARDRELAAFASRIEGWRGTRSFDIFKQDLIHMYKSRPIKTVDLHHHHDRLRTQKLQLDEAAKVYLGFEEAIRTHDEICQLLTVTSEAHGGLFYIFLGLLHPWRDVRYRTVELLERLGRHEAGKRFFKGLGDFAEVAFVRVRSDKEAREQDDCNNGLSRFPTQ